MDNSKYPKINFNIVLVEPEIPNNTGNIGRTCVGTWCKLHLVSPLGFEINDRQLKRAGLDYWPNLDWCMYENWDQWWCVVPDPRRVFFLTTKTKRTYFDIQFQEGDWLVFGKETKGLGPEILQKFQSQTATIPISGGVRSLNLATAGAIVIYEGLRQIGFNPA